MCDLNLGEHGDLVERKHVEYVRERFPAYEAIWKAYIGNDGRAHPLALLGASEKEFKRREESAQLLYTVFQSMVCLQRLCGRAKERDCPSMVSIESDMVSIEDDDERLAEYHLSIVDDFLAFHAHAGRVRDAVGELGILWRDRDLSVSFAEVYGRRSNVLHSSAFPVGMVEGAAAILEPAGRGCAEGRWSTRSRWSEYREQSAELISTYMEKTLSEIGCTLQSVLERLKTKILDELKRQRVSLEPHERARDDAFRAQISTVSDPDVTCV